MELNVSSSKGMDSNVFLLNFTGKLPAAWKQGTKDSAVIEKIVANKITLRFSNGLRFDVKAKSGGILGNIGDIVNMQIEWKNNTLKLKQIADVMESSIDNMEESNPAIKSNPVFEWEGKSLAYINKVFSDHARKREELEYTVEGIRKQLLSVANRLSNLNEKITDMGFSIDKLSLSTMHVMLSALDNDFETNEATAEEIQAQMDEFLESFEKNEIADIDYFLKYIAALMKGKMPVTLKNVGLLDGMTAKLNSLKDMKISSLLTLLKSEKDINIKNSYSSLYCKDEHNETISDSAWEKLEPSVIRMLEDQGLENSDKNLTIARLLVSNNVPVTKKNIEATLVFTDIDESIDFDALLDEAVTYIKQGESPLNAMLLQTQVPAMSAEAFSELKNNIPHFDYNIIRETVNSFENKSIDNLTLKSLNQAYMNYNPNADQLMSFATQPSADEIKAKRQLYEISLMMNYNAMVSLVKRGVYIDLIPLQAAVDRLRQMERGIYINALQVANLPETEENINVIDETMHTVRNIESAIEAHLQNQGLDTPITISSLHESSEKAAVMETKNSPDYSMETFIKKLLDSLSIEQTAANIKAVTILSQAGLAVTVEAIERAKLMDLQVNRLIDKLNPYTLAEIMKSRRDPMKMKIEDMLAYIERFEKMLGRSSDEKVESYIKSFNRHNTLTDSEKTKMTSIYRILSAAEKTDGGFTGFMLKNKFSPSLNNLLKASESFEKFFPELSREENNESTLSKYNQELVKIIIGNADPQTLRDTMLSIRNQQKEVLDISMEQFNESLVNSKANREKPAERVASAYEQTLNEIDRQIPLWLRKNNIPDTLPNMGMLQSFIRESGAFGKMLQDFEKDIKKILKDNKVFSNIKKASLNDFKNLLSKSFSTECAENLNTISKDIEHVKNALLATASNEDVPNLSELMTQISQIQNALDLQKEIQKKTSYYQVPVRLNSIIENVNCYVVNQQNVDGGVFSALFSLMIEGAGNVQCLTGFDHENVSISLSCKNSNARAFLEKNLSSLVKFAENHGYKISNISIYAGVEVNPLDTMVKQGSTELNTKMHNDTLFDKTA